MTTPNTIDAVELARKVVATGNIHDSGPRIDILARALLAADARCKQLEEGLREAMDHWDSRYTYNDHKEIERLENLLRSK